MKHTLIRLALISLLPAVAAAQPSFIEITPQLAPWATPAEEDFWVNAVAPADVDADGDLDLAVLGFFVVYHQSVEDRLVVLLNEGPDGGGWSFSEQPIPLGDLFAGASDLAWGDLDGDGDHDLAVGSGGAMALYRNNGGVLSALAAGSLPVYWEDSEYTGAYDLRSLTWADHDNDGDLDLLVPSVWDDENFEFRTVLLRNDGPDGGGGWLLIDAGSALDPTTHAQSAWADDDGDGDLDLFLANSDPHTETGFVRRFRNDGDGEFAGSDLLPIRVEYGSADWGDYDADGDLDLLIAGNVLEADGTYDTVLRVYRNDGAGGYSEITLIGTPHPAWLDLHAATWADYDGDGDIDLLVTGSFVGAEDIEGKSEVYANEGGVFTPLGVALPAPISSIGRGGSFTWFDVEGDGDLDYLVAGAYYVPAGNGLVEAQMHLYRNDAAVANAAPSAPSGLAATPSGGSVELSWTPAIDDHTPFDALTYELEVRPAGQPAGAALRLPQPGGISAVTSWPLAGLPSGVYLGRVSAVDASFHGGPAVEVSFVIPDGGPIFADGFESGGTAGWSAAAP